jgi:hypothetical protein
MRQSLLPGLLLFAPALASFVLVACYGVNVPFQDQWHIAPIFLEAARGELTFSDLVAQHNESRKLFPRLVYLGAGLISGWNTRVEMLLTQGLVLLTLVNLALLGIRGWRSDRRRALALGALASAMLFSPIQHFNFTFGIQLCVYLPAYCLTACLLLATSRLGAYSQAFLYSLLCTVATFSYANGMICWVLIAALLWSDGRSSRDRRLGPWVVWGLGFAANLALYFWDYARPAHHPPFGAALDRKLETVFVFLALLGAPLSGKLSHERVAFVVGFALTLLYATLLAYVALRRHDGSLRERSRPWLLLGAYAIVTSAVIAAGRIGFGGEAVLHSRYMAFSLLLAVALVFLVPLCLDHAASHATIPIGAAVAVRRTLGIACAGLVAWTWAATIGRYPRDLEKRLQAKAAVLFSRYDAAEELLRSTQQEPEPLRSVALELDRLGLLRPSLLGPDLADSVGAPSGALGAVEGIDSEGDGRLRIRGWACLARNGRPADAVLITRGAQVGRLEPVSLVRPRERRSEIADRFGLRGAPRLGWSARLQVPDGSTPIGSVRAWAVDADLGRIHALSTGSP